MKEKIEEKVVERLRKVEEGVLSNTPERSAKIKFINFSYN